MNPNQIQDKELNQRLVDALDALQDMYLQYCDDGHAFMSAGERACLVLERENRLSFDEAGRPSNISQP